MSDQHTFGFESTTDDVLEGVDLTGIRAVVTGSSGGLGLETARALAAHGADVVLAARDAGKLAAAKATVDQEGAVGSVETLVLDLASLDAVRAAAAELTARHSAINLLINNAGVMACPFSRTADGFEMQFGTNHLGHFLFTNLLLDALAAGAAESGRPSRVVELSSAGHRTSDILWDDPNFEHTDYFNFTAYGQSKTANALFAVELDLRCRDEGVRAFSVHPGVIMTDLSRHLTADDLQWMADRASRESGEGAPGESSGGGESRESAGKAVMEAFRFKSTAQGAATSVWAATAPGLEDHGGAYLEDCHVADPVDDPRATGGVQPWARDPDAAARLWEMSEQMVGL